MNYRLISKYLGIFCFALGLTMIPAALWTFYFEDWKALESFALSVGTASMIGGVLVLLGRNASEKLWQREALALVSLSWLAAAVVGALPFIYDGVLGPVDAFFESMSGFTTTGSTVIVDIEATSKSILFWRSMMQWLGGVGIVVLFIAVLPYLGAGGKQLFKSEASGPDPRGLTPRIKDTASILYKIYGGLTVAMTLALMVAGMNFYDALAHTMTALSSGGFSPRQASVAAYDSVAIEVIIIFFMGAAGTSFALFFTMIRKDWLAPLRDTEWKVYILIAIVAIVFVTANLMVGLPSAPTAAEPQAYSLGHALRAGSFQVMSILTCTGFVTDDFDRWPSLSRVLLFSLMFIGGCAGSTSGGIKVVRIIILAKVAYWRVEKTFRPKTIRAVRIGDTVIDDETARSIHSFFVMYLAWFLIGSLFMAALGLSFDSAMSSVATTMSNTGPGLGAVGATEDFSHLPAIGKLFLSLCMMMGRLEVFSLFVFFLPAFWKHS